MADFTMPLKPKFDEQTILGEPKTKEASIFEKALLNMMLVVEPLQEKVGDPAFRATKLYNDIVQRGRTEPITEADFSADDLKHLRNTVNRQESSSGRVDYRDYVEEGRYLNQALGGFRYTKEDNGDIVITDTYDFNKSRGSDLDENPLVQALGLLISPRELAAKVGRDRVPDEGGRGVPVNIRIKNEDE